MSFRINLMSAAIFLAVGLATANAAIISTTYVESRTGGKNFAVYSDTGVASPNSWSDSTAKSTASGTTAGIGSRFNSNAAIGGAATWFQVNPTLPTAGGTYDVYVTSTNSNQGTVNSTITLTGGTGLPATTAAFSPPGNSWNLVGTMTLNSGVNNPTIRFAETANSNRFYADAVRFDEVEVVPEPASLALLGFAAVGMGIIRHRFGR